MPVIHKVSTIPGAGGPLGAAEGAFRAAGVTANALSPSMLETPANRRIWPNA